MCSSIQFSSISSCSGREADRAEHAEPAGLAHGDDDVAAVGEREDRELDAELVADGGVHACSSVGGVTN